MSFARACCLAQRVAACVQRMAACAQRVAACVLCILFACLLACRASAADEPSSPNTEEKPEPSPVRIVGKTILPDSTEVYLLGEIIVTAKRLPRELPVRSADLDREELAIQPGHNATDALKSVPGVTVSAGRKDEASVAIRGFGSRRVAIMIDGRPMNVPYYGTFNLASLDVDELDKVQIVRGPASVTYGPNVMGGVVNFVTTRGRDRPGTRLRLQGGNHNTGEVLVTHGRVRGPWDLYLSMRGGGSDGSGLSRNFTPTGYAGTEDGGFRDNSDRVEYDLFAKIGYTNERTTDAAFSCGYLDMEKGVPSAIDEERYWRFTDWRRYFGDFTLSRSLGPKTTLQGKAYGDVFINTLVDYEDNRYDLDAAFYNSTHRNWDLGGIVAVEHAWSERVQGKQGITLREDQIKKRMNPGDPWLYHHQVTGSIYSEQHVQLMPQWRASLGLADHFMVYNHLKDTDHILGLDAGLTGRLAADWKIFAAFGRSTRFPTLSQLWSENTGNRNLRPEVAHRTETGVDWSPRAWTRTEATLFLNELDDLIDRDAHRAGRYYNIQSARSYGFEVSEALRMGDWLQLEAGYTYTDAENRDTGLPLDLTPEHKLDGRLLVCSRSGETQWSLVVSRVGSRYDSESLTEEKMLSGYTVADCRVTSRLERRLALTLEVMNIGDVNYEEEVMYPAPGRTVLVSVAIDLQSNDLE